MTARIVFTLLVALACTPAFAGIRSHAIDASLDPDTALLRVTDDVVVDDGAFDGGVPFRFLLNAALEIESVQAGGRELEWTERDGFDPKHFWDKPDWAALADYDHAREVTITLPKGFEAATPIRITYAGAVADSLHAPEEEYGRGFETTTGLIESRGAYLAGGTFWLPTVPGDDFTFTLSARVPAAWYVVSQGKLVTEESNADHHRVSFDCPHPMTEAYLVAGPWVRRHVTHGDVDVYTYTYAEDEALTSKYLDATGAYLDRYEAAIGPYPFAKFALVENFWETGYGMPGFTLLGSTVIRLPFIVHTSYGHEILHCWWGNGVFPDTDTGNWSEGLTSFMADYAYKEDESEEAAKDYRRNQLTGYLNYVTGHRDLPLSAFRERHSGATQAIGYGKSLMVFHMLRNRVGPDAFAEGLRTFYDAYRFKTASWGDILDALETSSGEDLSAFHEQWIGRTGAPLVTLAEAHTDDGHVRVTLTQTTPTYALDIPVDVENAAGERTRHRVHLVENEQTFTLPAAGGAAAVHADPDFDVFRRLHRDEIPPVLSQTMGADRVVIVVQEDAPAMYTELAASWARKEGVRIETDDVAPDALQGCAVWLFGDTALNDRMLASVTDAVDVTRVASEAGVQETASWATTLRRPDDPAYSVSWLHLGDPDAASAVGRKIPHYGKYSYLVFDGATNVAKGTWPVSESPMIVRVAADGAGS